LYDAVYAPGETNSKATLAADGVVVLFLNKPFKHGKAIPAYTYALQLL